MGKTWCFVNLKDTILSSVDPLNKPTFRKKARLAGNLGGKKKLAVSSFDPKISY